MTTLRSAQNVQDVEPDLTPSINFARRHFFATSSCAASAIALPGIVYATALPHAELTTSDFRGVLNTAFRATALSHPTLRVASLLLTEVTESRHPHPSLEKSRAKEMAFSLKFAVCEAGFSQDTYLLSHPTLGDFAALLVPTGNGKALRAEFHRL